MKTLGPLTKISSLFPILISTSFIGDPHDPLRESNGFEIVMTPDVSDIPYISNIRILIDAKYSRISFEIGAAPVAKYLHLSRPNAFLICFIILCVTSVKGE